MNKAVASLALLKANWDVLQRDYIENYVPFIVGLINRRKYIEFEIKTIRSDFLEEYGLNIPYHPMVTILNRVKTRGYVRKSGPKSYLPVIKKISESDFSDSVQDYERKYQKVINQFIEFSKDRHGEILNQTEAEKSFIAFLKDHDLDVLFASQRLDSILPEATSPSAHHFLVKRFVTDANINEPEAFNFILDVTIGHIIASTILFQNYERLTGKLKQTSFYLDTGFLFNLLGINGPEMADAYMECINTLHEQDAKLYVFRHTYDEFRGIIENCLAWVGSGLYDPSKASRSLIYFRDSGHSPSDVEEFILNIDNKIRDFGLEIVRTPAPNIDKQYQIDELELQKQIVGVYSRRIPDFNEDDKDFTIYQDVRSISAIFKLRRGGRPTSLRTAKHTFVTTNAALAYAAKRFDYNQHDEAYFSIPVALTDVLVGTLVWLYSPSIADINKKRLLAQCHAALNPSRRLIKKLVETAEHLQKKGEITNEDVIILQQSRIARNILQEETLGDPHRLTENTARNILDQIRERIRVEEREEYGDREATLLNEIKKREQRETEHIKALQSAIEEVGMIKRRAQKISKTIAGGISYIYYLVLIVVVLLIAIAQFSPSSLGPLVMYKPGLIIISAVLLIISLINGFNVKGSRDALKHYLNKWVVRLLLGDVQQN